MRSDESVVRNQYGKMVKVSSPAFEAVKLGPNDATSAVDDKDAFRQDLKMVLAEKHVVETKNAALEAEVLHLQGDLLALMFEVRVLRAAVTDTCEYRQCFDRTCVVRKGVVTVPTH